MAKDIERFDLQRSYFEKALARLAEVLLLTEDEVVRDSLIQRFEFTYEMAWKALFRFLADRGETMAAKAWDVFPVAFQSKLIDDAQVWDEMRKLRNDTSHEYSQERAVEAAAFIRASAYPALERLRLTLRAKAP